MARIVLVEDDLMLSEIYQTRIELAGYQCLAAYDGIAGLELIKQTVPDLVLLDLMLPRISGDQILEEMRKSEWGKDIKAIFLTNISESEAPDNIESLGFERYIVKANITNNQLVEIINQTINPIQASETV
jgi:DNA-binding response OmpR family regulator